MKINNNNKINIFTKEYIYNNMVIINDEYYIYKIKYKIKNKILPNNIKNYLIEEIDNDDEITKMWNTTLMNSLMDCKCFYKNIPVYKYILKLNDYEYFYIRGIDILLNFVDRNIMRATFIGRGLFEDNLIGYSDIIFNDINNHFYIDIIKKELKQKEKYKKYKNELNYILKE